MKVLVADTFERSGIDGLRGAGCEVVYAPELADDALTDAIADSGADVLVVRGTRVTAPMLDAGRVSLVVRAGAGFNTIDVAGASTRAVRTDARSAGRRQHRRGDDPARRGIRDARRAVESPL
jgi:D-3-phosphoglycerate dehydrogenase